ncbi:hypothetical protein [Xylanimonas allomyrinae]|uniref:hypothetical protein n=1 Tax=Xylanimonas allomyrinae TaxID=2509459 RepID=UPI001FE5E9E4|nr:hypothetical protein [Xylanimonas allomyrinae]
MLAAALLTDGGWAVATRTELITTDGSADVVVRHVWSDVDRASFDPAHAAITVRWVDQQAPLRLRLADATRSRLARVVRERVEWSVVLAEEVPLPGDRTARVAVRRDVDGTLFSQVLAGAGVDLDAPDVGPVVDAAEQRVRAAAGMAW